MSDEQSIFYLIFLKKMFPVAAPRMGCGDGGRAADADLQPASRAVGPGVEEVLPAGPFARVGIP